MHRFSLGFFVVFFIEQAPSAASKIFKDPLTSKTDPHFPKCYLQNAALSKLAHIDLGFNDAGHLSFKRAGGSTVSWFAGTKVKVIQLLVQKYLIEPLLQIRMG